MTAASFNRQTAGPLAHVRVLELASEIAAPYAARLLGDLGADVVKVESSDGDPLRRHGPFASQGPQASGALFEHLNANKRSLRLDLSADRSRVLDLAARVDILIEDQGAGELERLGLGPTLLRQANPRLALVRLSEFGQAFPAPSPGPFVLQAMAGWIDNREGESVPTQVGGRLNEYIAGGYIAAHALTAYVAARRGGMGVDADVSLLECTHGALCFPTVTQGVVDRLGGAAGRGTLLGAKPCRDGWAGINVLSQKQFADLCALVGAEEYAHQRDALRKGGSDREDFETKVSAWTRRRDVFEVVALCQGLRIPAVPLHDGRSILQDPQWRERPFFTDAASRHGGFLHPSFPWRLSATPAATRRVAPLLGEHDEQLPDMGWDCRSGTEAAGVADELPFAGLRVLSLGTYWSGASAASYFGAMGADVIKIESIQRPDGWRMNMVSPKLGERWWERGRYRATNLNQRDVTLNLESEEGRGLFARLVSTADIVLENFAAGVIGRLGFDWPEIHRLNPKTIMLRLPSFGIEGPRRDQVGFGPAFAQFAGHATLTGFPDRPPQTGGGFLDPTVGAHAVVGAIAALEARRVSGVGQLVEVPQTEVGVCVSPEPAIVFSLTGEVMNRTGNRAAGLAPQGVYQARDGRWVALSVRDDVEWKGLVEALGSPFWTADPALGAAAVREARHDELDAWLAAWAATDEAASLVDMLKGAGVPAAAVAQTADFLSDPRLSGRGYYEVVDHAVVGPDTYPGWPVRFSPGPGRSHRFPSPLLGEHNAEVLGGELGLTPAHLEALARRQVIGSEPLGL